MLVSDLLRRKGANVATIAPTASVAQAIDVLRDHGIGALVVSSDGRAIEGIVSERDVVRQLAAHGADILALEVSKVMTVDVQTCDGADSLDHLMSLMTERRIRHLPVLSDGALGGVISIGDVVKGRLDELEEETRKLTDYITTGR